ncbi:MFS transporter [Morganella morganii]|nr:MFS transporter [Morganella morganii]
MLTGQCCRWLPECRFRGDATLYGILTTSIGIGAVAGAFSLSALRARFSTGILVTAGTAGTVIVLVIFAVTTSKYLAIAGSIIAGFSWLITLSTLMVSAQTALPDWVRARGLALYLTVFSGSMALGSLIWGADCLTHINNNRAACGGSRYYCCLVMCAESEN